MRRSPFPRDAQELTLATAWKLTEDNHTVLVYCPEKRLVDSFAKKIVDLNKRGALESVLSVSEESIAAAVCLGQEWLGNDHPILACLRIGVAIHHGSLPTAFRKELERLLRSGVLKITISSPTLAQGLNLAATAIIMHSLTRSGQRIDKAEFKNVVGRAGRAFIDTHGLVLYTIFDRHQWRKEQWRELVDSTSERNMESGLVRLVFFLLKRISLSTQKATSSALFEYLAESIINWSVPVVVEESEEEANEAKATWDKQLATLDTALLSLLGNEECSADELENMLEEVLQSSLWERRLRRHADEWQKLFNLFLAKRCEQIWAVTTSIQRKGYYLAGVGLETGLQLDAISKEANNYLLLANVHILMGMEGEAINV